MPRAISPTNHQPWDYLPIGRDQDERQEANLRAFSVLRSGDLTQEAAPGLARKAAQRGVQDCRRKNGVESRQTTKIRRLDQAAEAQFGPDPISPKINAVAQKAETTPQVVLKVLSRPQPRLSGDEAVLQGLAGQDPTPEDKAQEKERNFRLWRALGEGSLAQQRAAHGILAGWAMTEIAALEGVGVSAIQHRLRGLAKIMRRHGVTL